MAESEFKPGKTEAKVHDLFAAVERVRNAQAERGDSAAEIEQAAKARLELLAQDLRPVFDDVPQIHDQFQFALSGGPTPRLWIDATSFVRIGRDRRTYEFVKDTRLGRTVLAETANRRDVGRVVTDYVAERILERERAIEGDWVAMGRPKSGRIEPRRGREIPLTEQIWPMLLVFAFGIIAGAAVMVAWFGTPPSP